jgi:hypothetical protein
MSMPTPKSSNWSAVEDRQPPGARLTVKGLITTTNSNQVPHLTKTNPQGSNPTILLLDLSITAEGVGSTVLGEREVQYRETIKASQYTSVEIQYEGQRLETIDHIEVVR